MTRATKATCNKNTLLNFPTLYLELGNIFNICFYSYFPRKYQFPLLHAVRRSIQNVARAENKEQPATFYEVCVGIIVR